MIECLCQMFWCQKSENYWQINVILVVVYNLFERRWARWDSGLGLVGLVAASSQSTPPVALAWTRRWYRTPPGNSCLGASGRSTPPLRHLHIKHYIHFLSKLYPWCLLELVRSCADWFLFYVPLLSLCSFTLHTKNLKQDTIITVVRQ